MQLPLTQSKNEEHKRNGSYDRGGKEEEGAKQFYNYQAYTKVRFIPDFVKTDFYLFNNRTINYNMSKSTDTLKQEIAELKQKLADYVLATDARIAALESSSTPKQKEKKPKAEKAEKVKAEKPKAEKPKTNCPKISKKLTEELEKILGALYPEEKKERDEMNKKFRDFANAIPEEDYKTMEITVIVTNFKATLENPKGNDTDEETLSGGGSIKVMSTSDLNDVQDEVSKTSDVGVYLLDGQRVTGPLRDEENEDLVTHTYKGTEYEVDESTNRVYSKDTEEFLGYARIKNKKFDGLIGK
jgi:hypothetical protein